MKITVALWRSRVGRSRKKKKLGTRTLMFVNKPFIFYCHLQRLNSVYEFFFFTEEHRDKKSVEQKLRAAC